MKKNDAHTKVGYLLDCSHDLAWFMERIGTTVYKRLKLIHEYKSITIIDVDHARYLFYTQERIGSEYFESKP